MAEDKKDEGEQGAAPAGGKSKKKLIIIIAAVLVLLGGGGGAFFLMGGKKDAAKPDEKPAEEERVLATAEIPTIIVNLSESTSFLKLGMLIEYDQTAIERLEGAHVTEGKAKGGGEGGGHAGGEGKEGGLPGPLARREPMIKDAIIKVLSSKKAEEVLTTDGKEKLKEELVEAINEASALDEPVVVGIYFTEFIIQ